jgi:hypothetical protein
MKELTEYRVNLIARLVQDAHAFRAECLAVEDPFASIDGGWNVHQIATHTRDVDQLVYGLRARRTAVEDNPEFPNFDGEAYMKEHYSPDEPLNQIVNQLVQNVESLAQTLQALPVEGWSRVSRHASLGTGFTLQSWVERGLAHIDEHLETIRKRKTS